MGALGLARCLLSAVCPELAYLHVHNVVVDPELVLLQHLQERLHGLSGGEELQVGLWGGRHLSRPRSLLAAASALGSTSQMPVHDCPREGPTHTGVAGHLRHWHWRWPQGGVLEQVCETSQVGRSAGPLPALSVSQGGPHGKATHTVEEARFGKGRLVRQACPSPSSPHWTATVTLRASLAPAVSQRLSGVYLNSFAVMPITRAL